jgi:hypothetical protein
MVARNGNQTTYGIDDASAAVSWAAVIAGAVGNVAVTLILLAFGVGVGFSVISPWAGEGVSTTTFTISAGVYVIAIAMLASTVGGYLAGRLRSQWSTVHEHERYFRDSAHGFLTWAFALVVGVGVLGGAFTHIFAGASAGAAPTAATASQNSGTDSYVDTLLRADPTASPALLAGQAANAGANRAEVTRILTASLRKGASLSDADHTYLGKVVSARTGLPPIEAQQRVDQVVTQAKSAADAARKSAAIASLWLVVAMLAGALSASLAAIEGGNLRNREWYRTERTRPRMVAAE